MAFDDASEFVMPFGPYQGQTLAEIASTDQGLDDLDAMLLDYDLQPDVHDALDAYLGDLADGVISVLMP